MIDRHIQPELKIEKLIHEWSGKGIFPGISILVARKDRILLQNAYGFKSLVPQREPAGPDTVYDLASLTKPLITAFLVLYFVECEKISLETAIKDFFPSLPFDFTIGHLLTHTSGLPAWDPLYLQRRPYIEAIASLQCLAKPGTRAEYSCLGYILLSYVLEKIGSRSFVQLAEDIIITPLKLSHTFLKVHGDVDPANIAPTENGNGFERRKAEEIPHYREPSRTFDWRNGIIRGETHDGNSFYGGGSVGNAGLFSNTMELFKLSLEFFPSTSTILKPDTISLFWENQTPFKKSHRTVGFKLNSSFQSSGGYWLSRKAIGHNGFTGTSLWMEPEEETKYIILSNRVHPAVSNYNFNKVRRRLHRHLKRLTTA